MDDSIIKKLQTFKKRTFHRRQIPASTPHSALCTLHSALSAYTLIEVLVALTVLIIGFSALATMTTRARRAAVAAEELSTAQLACQTRVNEMLAGVRPFTPVFREPMTGLDAWFLTVELFPASKPGVTAVRVQISRDRQPGDTTTRHAGTDFFEITHWINNSRLGPELLQAMQRNPYALTVAGMTPNPMGAMTPGMSGPSSLTDSPAGDGLAGGMTQGGMMPFDYSGGVSEIPPPLSLPSESDGSTRAFPTSEDRRAYRESLSQRVRPANGAADIDPLAIDLPDAPPPLDLPLDDPLASTIGATATPTTPSLPPPPDDAPATSLATPPATDTDSPGVVPSPDGTPGTGRNRPQGGNGNASPDMSGGRGGNPSNRRGGGP
ncbi:MAG: hypothetical protein FWH27_12695 [Planctomycetaceae bacterium]|nr:hypothetical protein [Planctomycetaceae bacterium]